MQTLEPDETLTMDEIKFNSILDLQRSRRLQSMAHKDRALKLTRHIPMQLLAREWFYQIDSSTEMRAYLIENFLPILVLGCERVLNEAQARDLVQLNRKHDDFNPINCLAQFLMRNNPKFNNHNETSPYVKTMRELYEELKEQMFFIQGNKLAKVKEEVRRRQNEKRNEENLKRIEAQRRRTQIERLFGRFYLNQNGRLELQIINEMFKIFHHELESLPVKTPLDVKLNESLLPNYCFNKDMINFQRRLLRHEFVECITLLSDRLKSDMFDFFLELFDESAVLVVNMAKANKLDQITQELVKLMDTTKSGYLIRKRVIKALKQFMERNKKLNLHEPLEWPVLDPVVKFENRVDQEKSSWTSLMDKQEPINVFDTTVPPTAEPKSAEKSKTSLDSASLAAVNTTAVVPGDEDSGTAAAARAAAAGTVEPSENADETNATGTTSRQQDFETAAATTTGQQEEGTASNVLAGGVDDDRKTSLIDEEMMMAAIPTKKESISSFKKYSLDLPLNSISSALERNRKSSKEIELLFLKDGVLYYSPLKEPLAAFDSSLFADKNLLSQTRSDQWKNDNKKSPSKQQIDDVNRDQYAFDSKLVNAKQFANLIRNFLGKNLLDSEIYVNDLIAFLRENYQETSNERIQKLEQLKATQENERQTKKLSECFEKLDNEGSGALELDYLVSCLNSFRSGLFKDTIGKVRNEMFGVDARDDTLVSKRDFFKFMNELLVQLSPPSADSSYSSPPAASPYQDQLVSHLNSYAKSEPKEKARGENRKEWLRQIKYVGDVCLGSFEPLYKQLFLTILKDAENHGNLKMLSAYVGILEKQQTSGQAESSGGEVALRYHASTPNDSRLILGKVLTRSSDNVSFGVIDNGSFLHVGRVRSNSNIFFFNPENKNDGSLLIYPLKFPRNNVFGVIGIDTLQQKPTQASNGRSSRDPNFSNFTDDEVKFYNGVAGSFSEAYINLIFKNRLIKCCRSATEWLYKTCNKRIEGVSLYFVQRLDPTVRLDFDPADAKLGGLKPSNINVKKIMRFDFRDGLKAKLGDEEKSFANVDYFLGSKLYDCAMLSETTVSHMNGKISLYVPLRNQTQKAVLIMEIIQKDKPLVQDVDYDTNLDNADSNINNNEDDYDEDETRRYGTSQNQQLEIVLNVLYKCQQSLVDEHFMGLYSSESRFEYEVLFEEEKFAILFEKCYMEFALGNLRRHVNLKLDIVESNRLLNEFLNTLAQLIDYEELRETQIVDDNVLDRLRALDPTRQESEHDYAFDRLGNISIKDLTELYRTSSLHDPLKSLLEWFLLMVDMKSRKESIKSTN